MHQKAQAGRFEQEARRSQVTVCCASACVRVRPVSSLPPACLTYSACQRSRSVLPTRPSCGPSSPAPSRYSHASRPLACPSSLSTFATHASASTTHPPR